MKHTTLKFLFASAIFTLGLSLQTARAQEEADDPTEASEASSQLARPVYGDRISLGAGYVRTFHRQYWDGTPYAIGVKFPGSTLTKLPMQPNDGLNCWDLNGDNQVDLHEECSGGHNRTLFFNKNNTPFKWISVDWEPHGHVPEDIYGARHFDFHFYMTDVVERNKIAVGPCMPGTINCAQSEIAVRPVAPQYIHPDFFNTKLAFSRMGNHWADRTSPEFNGQPFTQTFILGSYDSKITFYEPMMSLDYLKSKPNQCSPIKLPAQYQSAGYYPTIYCIRYHSARDMYTVSLEKFVKRSVN
jgi:hypothetical protein